MDGLIVGHRLMAAGEYFSARKAYLRAGADNGLTVDVLSAIGSADLKLGRLGQAEANLRKALEKDPKFVPAHNNLGVTLMEQGRAGEAKYVFQTAFALDAGKSAAIRENLRLAIAKIDDVDYSSPNKEKFRLMRRGAGDYLILGDN
ncbi:MAG: tetratricopeptide repeat protein [Halocynthiibacter sp.]